MARRMAMRGSSACTRADMCEALDLGTQGEVGARFAARPPEAAGDVLGRLDRGPARVRLALDPAGSGAPS